MSIESALKVYPIDQLGSSSGDYLHFDEKTNRWSVVQLSCTEKLKRRLGLGSKCTTLSFIAEKMSQERNLSSAVLNKIHALWQKKYPAIRNPLKGEPYTLIDPINLNLSGNIKVEWMKVGEAYISLRQGEDAEFFLKASIPIFEKNEKICKHFINATLDHLSRNEPRKIALGFRGIIQLDAFTATIRIALLTIETYLYENPDHFDEIVIYFKQENVPFLARAIDICREMEHSHAQFFEPEPDSKSLLQDSLIKYWDQDGYHRLLDAARLGMISE
jgi:hypothetical protein